MEKIMRIKYRMWLDEASEMIYFEMSNKDLEKLNELRVSMGQAPMEVYSLPGASPCQGLSPQGLVMSSPKSRAYNNSGAQTMGDATSICGIGVSSMSAALKSAGGAAGFAKALKGAGLAGLGIELAIDAYRYQQGEISAQEAISSAAFSIGGSLASG